MNYRIGSFNVCKLNYAARNPELGEDTSSRKDYDTLGLIIRENFHIVALQEVLNESVLYRLFPPLSGWKYSWAQANNKFSNTDEGYAFAWDTKYITIAKKPRIWDQYRQDVILGNIGLYRHPYYGRFIPTGLFGNPFCEIRLINTHIRFQPQHIPPAFSGSQVALRQREFRVLTENILNNLASKQYGDHRPAYTFLMGDYNLNLRVPGNNSPYVDASFVLVENSGRRKTFVTVQEKKTTIGEVKGQNGEPDSYRFSSNYDHFTYIENYIDAMCASVETDAIDTVQLYRNGDFDKHRRELSDHIPIMLELNLRPGASVM